MSELKNDNGKRERDDEEESEAVSNNSKQVKVSFANVTVKVENSYESEQGNEENRQEEPTTAEMTIQPADDPKATPSDVSSPTPPQASHGGENESLDTAVVSPKIVTDGTGEKSATASGGKPSQPKKEQQSSVPQQQAHRHHQQQSPGNQTTIVRNPDENVEERGEISVEIAGRVIGKGGEIIRDLQARSGAQIDVDQSTLPGRPRVITYRGLRSKVEFAKKLVGMIASGVLDNNLPIGEAKREILIIPSSSTGKVIGRGGEMVREMQNRSHAKIDFDHSAANIGPEQKKVIVTGTHQAVAKAKEMILFLVSNPNMEAMQSINILVDDKLRGGGQWGSGPPYSNLPNQGVNMRPDMFDGGFSGGGGGGPYAGGGMPPVGAFPPMPFPHGGGGGPYSGPPPHAYGGPPGGGGMGRGHGGPGGGGAPGSFSDVMHAKKQFMGRIIGAKGVTINDLQRRSGTDIQINQDVTPGQDCEIRLKGTREGVETAKAMIQQIIDIGPNHPFAGGQGGPGGGMGPGGQGPGGGMGPGGQGGGGMGPGGRGGGGYMQPNYGGGYGGGGPPFEYGPPMQTPYSQGPYDPQGYQEPQAFGGYQQLHPQGGYGIQPPAVPYGGAHAGAHQAPHQQQSFGGPPIQGYGGVAGAPPGVNQGGYGGTQMAPQQQYGGYQQQQPPAPAPAVMDTGWKSTTTADGQTYYWNERTGATQWEKPPGMP